MGWCEPLTCSEIACHVTMGSSELLLLQENSRLRIAGSFLGDSSTETRVSGLGLKVERLSFES